MPDIPVPIVGVTSEDIQKDFDRKKKALQKIRSKRMPMIRIVLQMWRDPVDYLDAIKELHGTERTPRLAYVMCEVADSDFLWKFNDEHKDDPQHRDLLERLKLFLDTLGNFVDVWEIGNEVNGEWAGWKLTNDCDTGERDYVQGKMGAMRKTVGQQTLDVYHAVKNHPKTRNADTALTLYFYTNKNPHCWPHELVDRDCNKFNVSGQDYEMLKWLGDNHMTEPAANFHPTYVFLSVYEDDCRDDDCNDIDLSPSAWLDIFEQIQGEFEGAQVGFGEVGTHCTDCDGNRLGRGDKECVKLQRANVHKHYGDLQREITALIKSSGRKVNYVGGYFYWFFDTDMVSSSSSNKPALKELISALDSWR